MNINGKIRITSFALLFSIMSACTSINISASPKENFDTIRQNEFNKAVQSLNLAPGEKPTIVDVGNGKPGGTFAFKFNLNEGFKIKSNIPGSVGNLSNIHSFKLALINGSGGFPNPGSIFPATGCSGNCGPYVVNRTTGTPVVSLLLTNVPAGIFYVAVAAYQDSAPTPTINITTSSFTISGPDHYAVSTLGGDTNQGKITVGAAPTYTINGTAASNQMGVNLTLSDAVGASIDATVTTTHGTVNTTLSNIGRLYFYLVNSNAVFLTEANIKAGPFNITSGSPTFSGLATGPGPDTATVPFTNVPAGTYYVALATYSFGGIDPAHNLNNNASNTSNITINAGSTNLGNFAISNSGGDSNSGSIVVNADGSLNGTPTPLVLPLTLL